MLGVVKNPTVTPADEVMRAVAEEMGVAETFVPTPVGVFFGEPGVEVADPYFGGAGPARKGCIECGECMTGCRHGAKNSLLKNYLYLAEHAGAEVHPLTTVTGIWPRADGRYEITTERTGSWLGKRRRTFVATEVVLAAGTLGTQKLLHSMRDRVRSTGCRHGSASSPDPTPRRFSGHALSGATSTSPGEWRSPPRSTPTPRPTSSRCATAGEAMPWGYWGRPSPTEAGALALGPGRARWRATRS